MCVQALEYEDDDYDGHEGDEDDGEGDEDDDDDDPDYKPPIVAPGAQGAPGQKPECKQS